MHNYYKKNNVSLLNNLNSASKVAECRKKARGRLTSSHLYHYAGNNPICYIDPTGLSKDDWQNNGDGTWTVISEGATLWDIWGLDWDVLSGTNDEAVAENIHVGDVFGFKYNNSMNTEPNLKPLSSETEQIILDNLTNLTFPMLKSKCVLQGSLGALEIILGSLGYVGVTIMGLTEEAAALEANRQIDQSVAYSMMLGYSFCAVAIADGLGLIAGAFNEKSQSPIFFERS